MIHKNVAVYIWFQLCQILTDFNNFGSAETGNMYKTGHAFTYLLRGRRPAARASDLHVVRTGPVCCEQRHQRMNASSVGLCPCWRRAFWRLLMIATLKITMSKWQHCKFGNRKWLFLFSFAVNINEQRIIVFLTGKRCYLNLRSKVRNTIKVMW